MASLRVLVSDVRSLLAEGNDDPDYKFYANQSVKDVNKWLRNIKKGAQKQLAVVKGTTSPIKDQAGRMGFKLSAGQFEMAVWLNADFTIAATRGSETKTWTDVRQLVMSIKSSLRGKASRTPAVKPATAPQQAIPTQATGGTSTQQVRPAATSAVVSERDMDSNRNALNQATATLGRDLGGVGTVSGSRGYILMSPVRRQRLDHYVGRGYRPGPDDDPEGWDSDGWHRDYVEPWTTACTTWLATKKISVYGGTKWVEFQLKDLLEFWEVGEKGHLDFKLTDKGKAIFGEGIWQKN